jgi:hypothetical protein
MTYERKSILINPNDINAYLQSMSSKTEDYRLLFYNEIVKSDKLSMVTTVWEITKKKKKLIDF